jgi:hypothetical protein
MAGQCSAECKGKETTMRKSFFGKLLLVLFVPAGIFGTLGITPAALGQDRDQPAAAAEADKDGGWPKMLSKGDTQILVYQPQLTKWDNYEEITLTMAVAVSGKDYKDAEYGVLEATAKTDVDTETRMVLMTDFRYALRFPYAAESKVARLEQTVRDSIPEQNGLNASLDRILAYGEDATQVQGSVDVSLDPPPIYYSDKPAILVVFIGEPNFQPIKDTGLMAAANTNWDMVLDTATSKYYLLNEESWLTASDPIKGPWSPAPALPADLSKLPDDPNWDNIRKNLPGKPADSAPVVFISQEPAELIVSEGQPRFAPISGTAVMDVSNSDSDLFYLARERNFYLLVAGRWFRAQGLNGPWTAATKDLPEDFAALPDNEKYGDTLASIPGTIQAEDAVLLASVPQRAVVNPKEMSATVSYQGEPNFQPIEQTAVSFAVNTPEDVFLVNSAYYCCQQGVWFQSNSSGGPWVVCTAVPDAIYRIPANHPKHNVTYVYVYDSTPDTVVVGYTSGYTGAYVAGGLLLFGAGILVGSALHDHNHYWHNYPWAWNPCYYSYGCRARYAWGYGGFYRGARCYGPWGGAGRGGYYNPITGGWARGSYRYGPLTASRRYAAYNPYSGVYRAHAGGRGVYGSWNTGVVARNDRWAAGGHVEGWNGKAGWVGGSGGRGALHYDTRFGSGTVIKGKNDAVFVGKDGNVYRRGGDGSWSKRNEHGWKKTDFDRQTNVSTRPGNRPDKMTRPGGRPENISGVSRPGTKDLQRPKPGDRPGTKDIQRPTTLDRPNTKDLQRPKPGERPGTKDIQRPTTFDRPNTKDLQRPTTLDRPNTKDLQRPNNRRPGETKPGSAGIAESLNRDANARARGNTNMQRFDRSNKSSSYKTPSLGGNGSSRDRGGNKGKGVSLGDGGGGKKSKGSPLGGGNSRKGR